MPDDLTRLIAEGIAAQVAVLLDARAAERRAAEAAESSPMTGLDLWRAYSAREAGAWLGLSADAVYAIPEDRLARHYTGRTGTTVRFLGINILMHVSGLPPVDARAIADGVRQRFVESAGAPAVPHVRSIARRGAAPPPPPIAALHDADAVSMEDVPRRRIL